MANKLPDSGPISMLDVYNVLNPPLDPKDCDYYFETEEDITFEKMVSIIQENNNDLSGKTFGFGDSVKSITYMFSYLFLETSIDGAPKMIVGNNITDVSYLFEDANLNNIPEKLLFYCPNIINAEGLFRNNISEIPENIFINNKKIEDLSNGFPIMSYIPPKILKGLNHLKRLNDYCFDGKYIPENLFEDCINLEEVMDCFAFSEITSIPENLFSNCIKLKNVDNCFSRCVNLENVPQNLFDNCINLISADGCFKNSINITSYLPEIWNKNKFQKINSFGKYGLNCCKIKNYNKMPIEAGGPILKNITSPQECDYYFETKADFETRINNIIEENNYELYSKTFGFSDNITDLSNIFKDMVPLYSTPKIIFANNVTNFNNAFSNSSIQDVCNELFKYCKNIKNINSLFENSTVYQMPYGLFENNSKIETAEKCFYYIYTTYIPDDLFNNCPDLNNVNSLFENSRVIRIPENIFNFNTKIKYANGVFKRCYNLNSNLENIFSKCSNSLIEVSECFYYCENMTFSLPEVWNKQKFPNIIYGNDYGYRCEKASNYNKIPYEFGGPYSEAILNNTKTLDNNTLNKTKSLVKSVLKTVNIPTSPISLNDKDFRELAGISSGPISLRDFYGKSTQLQPEDCDYYFETIEDFRNRIENIIVENNGDFINKTFGFGDSVLSVSSGFLYDTRVISTPKMIVANNITDVSSLFEMSGVIKISEKLFDNCKNIKDASLLFLDLENNNAIVELPENLLRNLTELNNLYETFSGINIVNIPNNFFANNKKISILDTTFSWTKIETIPEDLFINTNITSVHMCFYSCLKLKTIPQNLFSNCPNINEFVSCFEDCSSITSAVPELWKTHPNAKGTDCFKGCVNAANYNDIPSSWGGPKDESLILTIDCSQYNDTSVDAVIKSITSNQNHIINVSDLPNKIHTVKFKPGCIFTATMGPSDMPGFGIKLQYEDSSGNKASVGFTSGTVTKTLGPLNNNGYMKFYQNV